MCDFRGSRASPANPSSANIIPRGSCPGCGNRVVPVHCQAEAGGVPPNLQEAQTLQKQPHTVGRLKQLLKTAWKNSTCSNPRGVTALPLGQSDPQPLFQLCMNYFSQSPARGGAGSMDTQGCPHSSNAEDSKGRLGRCIDAEKQENKSCLCPFPVRSIFPPVASHFYHQAESNRETYFFQLLPKTKGQHKS